MHEHAPLKIVVEPPAPDDRKALTLCTRGLLHRQRKLERRRLGMKTQPSEEKDRDRVVRKIELRTPARAVDVVTNANYVVASDGGMRATAYGSGCTMTPGAEASGFASLMVGIADSVRIGGSRRKLCGLSCGRNARCNGDREGASTRRSPSTHPSPKIRGEGDATTTVQKFLPSWPRRRPPTTCYHRYFPSP